MRINQNITRSIVSGAALLEALTVQAQEENMETILDIHHILAYLAAGFLIAVFVTVFYNRVIYFREQEVTQKAKQLNAQLSLIMTSTKTEAWTYDILHDI